MRFARRFLASLLTLIAAASLASAEPVAFNIDPVHSQAGFTIRHFFTKVPGHFKELSGQVMFDEKNLAASSVNVEIKTASINTNNERRDGHLRSPDFFAADSFPTVTFKSTKVIPGQGNKFKVEGNLSMRGVTKPVVLDAEFLGAGPGPRGGQVAGFEATTTVNRKDYNILWNRVLDQGGTMLGDDVTVTLAIEAIKPGPEQPKPAAAADKK